MNKIFVATLFVLLASATFAQVSISGHVYDQETKEPIVGVTVLIPNTTHGAITDVNGRFEFSVDSPTDSLQVQSIGYESQRFSLKNTNELNVGLKASVTSMNEVVITGS